MKILARQQQEQNPLYKFIHKDAWIKVRRDSAGAEYYIRVYSINSDGIMQYNRTNIWPVGDEDYAEARFIHRINQDFWTPIEEFEIVEPMEVISTNELYEMCGVFGNFL